MKARITPSEEIGLLHRTCKEKVIIGINDMFRNVYRSSVELSQEFRVFGENIRHTAFNGTGIESRSLLSRNKILVIYDVEFLTLGLQERRNL